MANCLPFNAILVNEEYDRVYKAEDWAWYFATFIGNGVFPKPSDGLQVIAYDRMQVKVNAGYAFINGYAFRNPAGLGITLSTAEGALNRIDRVVIRWDLTQRDMYLTVLKGVPSAKPAAAALTRNTEIWELAIADIYVGKGVTKIQAKDITDQRFNSAVCGIVKGTVEEIDAGVLTKQFNDFFRTYSNKVTQEFEQYTDGMDGNLKELQEQWDAWFESIKALLEATENGELLEEIKALYEELYRLATESDIDRIIAGTYVDEDEGTSIFETATKEDIDNIISGDYTGEPETGQDTAVPEAIKTMVKESFEGGN